ncbi:MAG: hypothetical protein D6767_10775 [Candidatus Hydrogenedentota bacterium]|nr:MAG: hypothetical protein D6767_10775 [Candidatus Hydrogenedentota bacterium]
MAFLFGGSFYNKAKCLKESIFGKERQMRIRNFTKIRQGIFLSLLIMHCSGSLVNQAYQYSIGGRISGLKSKITLENNKKEALVLEKDGSFTFEKKYFKEETYEVKIAVKPAGQSCVIENAKGILKNNSITNIQIQCSVDTFTVGGTLSGLDTSGSNSVTLQLNGSNDLVLSQNGNFTFSTLIPDLSSYNVTIRKNPTGPPSQTCVVYAGSGNLNGQDITNVTVQCQNNSITVGGSVSGLSTSPANSVVLQNNGADDLTVSSSSPTFSFDTIGNYPYNITVYTQPTNPNQTCTVTGGSGTTPASSNVTGISVNCVTNQYTVGGTVSGLVSGNSIVLQNNGGDNLTVTSNGSFTFSTALNDLSAYNVTILSQPSGSPKQTCTVSNGSGSLAGGSVTSVSVQCSFLQYSIGGNLTGLAGGTVITLQLNTGETLNLSANGSFAFPTAVDDFTNYEVSIAMNPLNQACTIDKNAGKVNGANVTNISVSCAAAETTKVWVQDAYLKASNAGPNDYFGVRVGIFGNTIAVAGRYEDSAQIGITNTDGTAAMDNGAPDSGAVYVFKKDGTGNWYQDAYIKPSNTGAGDVFGFALDLSEDYLVISSLKEDSNFQGINNTDGAVSGTDDGTKNDSGAVYVFKQDASGNWSQDAYIKASNADAGDDYGALVAIDKNTFIVGATLEDSSQSGITNTDGVASLDNNAADSGAVYVYERDPLTGDWKQSAYLKPSNTQAGMFFSFGLDIFGDTIAVGARYEDSAQTGITNVNGTAAMDNGALDSGAVYIFKKDGSGNWYQDAYIKPSNTRAGDQFGVSVSLSKDILVVGAYKEQSTQNTITNLNGSAPDNSAANDPYGMGAVYVFRRYTGTGPTPCTPPSGESSCWYQDAYLKPVGSTGSIDSDDKFGWYVGVSGSIIFTTGHVEDSNVAGVINTNNTSSAVNSYYASGAGYIFQLYPTTNVSYCTVESGESDCWYQDAYLKASNNLDNIVYGWSSAISGTTIVVGAYAEDRNDNTITNTDGSPTTTGTGLTNSGAVYVYTLK